MGDSADGGKPPSGLARFMEKTWVIVSLELLTIVMSIVSMNSSVMAYKQLRGAVVDLQSISNNWAAKPIYAVEVTSTSSCPAGFSAMPTLTWPGAAAGNCACPQNAKYDGKSYTSSYTSCSNNQTSAGCLQDPAVDSISLTYWKSRRLCYKQGGEPAATFAPYLLRPRPTAGSCPAGYRKCGSGNYDANKAFCFPRNLRCPISGLSVGSAAPATNYTTNVTAGFDDGTRLYAGRFVSGLPLVDLQVAFTSGSGATTTGPCYFGDQRQNRYDGTTSWGSSLGSSSMDYPGRCKKYDSRYSLIDSVSEYKLLIDNFQNTTTCAGYNIKSNTVDYRAGGSACTGTSDCALPGASSLSCGSSDSICLAVKYQTKCGKLQHFATQAKASAKTVGLFGRPEIYWKSSCVKTQKSVKDVNKPVKKALVGQSNLMVINIIINTIIGLIFPLMLIYNAVMGDLPCCPGSGKQERTFVNAVKVKWSHAFRLIKFIPLIVAILGTNKVITFFLALAKAQCSDSITNYTISYLAATLPAVRKSNSTTLAMDLLQMILALQLTFCACAKKKKQQGAVAPQQQLPIVNPVQQPGGMQPMSPQPGMPMYYPPGAGPYPAQPGPAYPPQGYVPSPYPQGGMQPGYPMMPGQPMMMQPGQPMMMQPGQPMMMPYYPQQQAPPPQPTTVTKSMLCVIPKNAKPGDVIELVSLEGAPVKYVVPPEAVPGSSMNVSYEVPIDKA